jgi:hypothetical protein
MVSAIANGLEPSALTLKVIVAKVPVPFTPPLTPTSVLLVMILPWTVLLYESVNIGVTK